MYIHKHIIHTIIITLYKCCISIKYYFTYIVVRQLEIWKSGSVSGILLTFKPKGHVFLQNDCHI